MTKVDTLPTTSKSAAANGDSWANRLAGEAKRLSVDLAAVGLPTAAARALRLHETLTSNASCDPIEASAEMKRLSALLDAHQDRADDRVDMDNSGGAPLEVRRGLEVAGGMKSWSLRSYVNGLTKDASLTVEGPNDVTATIPLKGVTEAELAALTEELMLTSDRELIETFAPLTTAMQELVDVERSAGTFDDEFLRQALTACVHITNPLSTLFAFVFVFSASDELNKGLDSLLKLFVGNAGSFENRLWDFAKSGGRAALDVAMLLTPIGAIASLGFSIIKFTTENRGDIAGALKRAVTTRTKQAKQAATAHIEASATVLGRDLVNAQKTERGVAKPSTA